jgi:hypothetical protein
MLRHVQPPPTDRKYRAALATAIEPCSASFRRLVSAALTSESRLLRAAVVRVLARAAGECKRLGKYIVHVKGWLGPSPAQQYGSVPSLLVQAIDTAACTLYCVG